MLIGIIGCKRSGKDTVARIIQAADIYNTYIKELDLTSSENFIKKCLDNDYFLKITEELNFTCNYTTHAFADNVKACVSIITGICKSDLYNEDIKNSKVCFRMEYDKEFLKDDITYRQFLQRFGTEVGRSIDPDIWIKSLFKDYDFDKNWIISDVRYENEADFIKNNNGLLIRVNRGKPNYEHSSETGLLNYPNIDFNIDNNSNIDNLIKIVQNLIKKF